LEDQINELQKESYNAEALAGQLVEFVQTFPQLQAGERKLLVDALIARVEVAQNKRVTALLQPPLASFGYLSPSLAPRGIEPLRRNSFTIMLGFKLHLCYGQ
jgi:hypothetical protein